mmetsp:Transcript_8855/g.21557  ORF Transcript_8855/g.21557 Transcript_8855/m.21557 type:complete len:413 (-) Transcript_8855:613-1851(-)|eukprot:CAMPEP_0178991586 /NCGR_PEP_ID=MMETSP0795-20121207/5616_1 /TAXON_ID=88552 /ORGANISM="Amoebophrya sp., Strain Ameob2" /LENGTH=412 /DNA_ID=CAMNT_0020683323 /DNA_START=302 /DNA_END=1540 /DNA_ORIENTATION=-
MASTLLCSDTSAAPLAPDMDDSTAEVAGSVPALNPFLRFTGKEISTASDCPKAHGLKLFVSPLGKPCAVCNKQMPNGDRAWRCFPCDFHICIDCHDQIARGVSDDYDRGSVKLSGGYHNPQWDGKTMDPFGEMVAKEVTTLRDLLTKYAESTDLVTVNCRDVIPDFSNRGHTGLSVEHVHKVSQSMAKGFRNRTVEEQEQNDHSGYDIPVLVREKSQSSELGRDAIKNWMGIVLETGAGFPKPSIHLQRKSQDVEMFCSLGNGHFFQSLNNFRTGNKSIWTKTNPRAEDDAGTEYVEQYDIPPEGGFNPLLRDAVLNGIPSLVLRNDIPLKERTTICELLNKKSDYRWTLKRGPNYDPLTNCKDMSVDLDSLKEVDVKQSQFELLSKTLDGLELNCLVRQETGQTNSANVGK